MRKMCKWEKILKELEKMVFHNQYHYKMNLKEVNGTKRLLMAKPKKSSQKISKIPSFTKTKRSRQILT
jgi:hypothetical protein